MNISEIWRIPLRIMKAKLERVDNFKDQKYEKIKKQLTEQQCIFTDWAFPASAASLGAHFSNTSTILEWKRPKELSESPRLFDNASFPSKVQSGELSHHWLVSAFSILSGVRELCYKIVVNYHEQEWDSEAEGHHLGIFHFRFWRFGQWVKVVVDDLLPTKDGKLVFTHSVSKNEYWVSLAEKAYAKLLGSYDALEGHFSDALVDMTGGVSEIIDLKAREYDSIDERKSELLHLLITEMADHSIMCASIVAYSEDDIGQRTEFGLVRGETYHITAVKKIHLGDMKLRNLFKGREKVAMIRLRDTSIKKTLGSSPTRSVTSNTEDDAYAYSTSQLTRLLSRNPIWAKMREHEKDRIGLTTDNEGEFWMPFEDFVSNFQELTIIRLFNNNIFSRGRGWYESSVSGRWTAGDKGSRSDRSGGGNIDSETFFRNPQYLFYIDKEEDEITIQMLQWDGVEPATPLSTSQSRFFQRTLLIGFSIIKVELNRKYRLHKLWSFCQPLVSIDHQRKRELYYRGFFPKGKYLLVPTTFKTGAEGSFLIRIFSQGDVKLRELQRDAPNRISTLSCLSSPEVWVTVISVKSAAGLGSAKNVYCLLKCENQKVKTQINKSQKEIEWNDVFVFYRKYPERPIVIKVYSRHMLARDKFMGWTEIPAAVNHASTQLEATLFKKDNNLIENAIIRLEALRKCLKLLFDKNIYKLLPKASAEMIPRKAQHHFRILQHCNIRISRNRIKSSSSSIMEKQIKNATKVYQKTHQIILELREFGNSERGQKRGYSATDPAEANLYRAGHAQKRATKRSPCDFTLAL